MRARVWLVLVCAVLATLSLPSPAAADTAPTAVQFGSTCNAQTGEWTVGWTVTAGDEKQRIKAFDGTESVVFDGWVDAGAQVRFAITLPAGVHVTPLQIRYWSVGETEQQARTVYFSADLPTWCVAHDADPVAYFQHFCGREIGVYLENRAGAATEAWFSISGPSHTIPYPSPTLQPGESRWVYITAPFWEGSYAVRENGILLAETFRTDRLNCASPWDAPVCPCASGVTPPSPSPTGTAPGTPTDPGGGPTGPTSGGGPAQGPRPSPGVVPMPGGSRSPAGAQEPDRRDITEIALGWTQDASGVSWLAVLVLVVMLLALVFGGGWLGAAGYAIATLVRSHRDRPSRPTWPPGPPWHG